MSEIINGLIGGLMAMLVTTYVAKRMGKASSPGQLRFGLFTWSLGLVCLGLALFPIVIMLLGEDRDGWATIVQFVAFGSGAVYCFGEAAFVRGSFDAEGISFSTPWAGTKQEKWQDLESAKLNDWCNWYTLTFRSGNKIRLSRSLRGHRSALEVARENCER